jgi:hypothetical protein
MVGQAARDFEVAWPVARSGKSSPTGGMSGWLTWSAVPGCWGGSRARAAASVSVWIGAQTRQSRAGVQVVAIDMCTVFEAAVRDSLSHVSTRWPRILTEHGAVNYRRTLIGICIKDSYKSAMLQA